MKTTEIIFGIAFTLAIFGPLFYLFRWANKRKMKVVKALKLSAITHELKLSELEVWNDKGFGYDITKKSLIYISILNDLTTEKFVNLQEVKDIRIITNHDVVTIQINTFAKELINLEIFNSLFDEPLNAGFHILLAKKWVDTLKKDVKTTTKKAA